MPEFGPKPAMAGFAGASVSTISDTACVAAPLLPAASVAKAATVRVPSLSALRVTDQPQVPSPQSASAVPVPSTAGTVSPGAPPTRLTNASGSARPEKTRFVTFVGETTGVPSTCVIEASVVPAGAAVSTVKPNASLDAPALPAASVAAAVRVWDPSANRWVVSQWPSAFTSRSTDQLPVASCSRTTVPASAMPRTVSDANFVRLPIWALAASSTTNWGAAGDAVSTVRVKPLEDRLSFPASSSAMAWRS